MKKVFFSVFLLLMLLFSTVYASPQSEGFSHYVTISLDADDVDADLADFPVLIHLNESCGINGFDASPIFEEIGDQYNYTAYVDSVGDRLYFEVEYWNSTETEAFIWVKVPSVSDSSDTVIALWFEKFVDGSAYNSPADVWGDYAGVWHMNDATTSTILDSTSNNNDGTKTSANNPLEVTGQIGKAQSFDGDDDIISPTIAGVGTGDLSVGLWINGGSQGAGEHIICRVDTENTPRSIFGILATGTTVKAEIYDSTQAYKITTPVEALDNTFHYIVAVRDGDNLRFYVDGAPAGTVITGIATYQLYDAEVSFGKYREAAAGYYTGIEDEVQYVETALSSAWIGASYETQRDHLNIFGAITLYVRASRGEFLAAGLVISLILVPLLILIIFVVKRRR